ncbi:hypothetical protein AB0L82_38680 [Nocardia sp. NPDC052001]|uniref:hypothetical protein n=1 Tax=Nocardia sp. NPDC052001 TaxID=3154853 RepID=UPI003431B80B
MAAIVYDVARRSEPLMQLKTVAWGQDAEAVITPSARHLSYDEAVGEIVATSDVVYLDTAQRFRRERTGVTMTDLWNPEPSGGTNEACVERIALDGVTD